MKKIAILVSLASVISFISGCNSRANKDETYISSMFQFQEPSENETTNSLFIESVEVEINDSSNILEESSTDISIGESNGQQENALYQKLDEEGVVGGFSPEGAGYYLFCFHTEDEFADWIRGHSELYITDENQNKVKIHENDASEEIRRLLKGEDEQNRFYSLTINGAIQQTDRINVKYFSSSSEVGVYYTVRGDNGNTYDMEFRYFIDKETRQWLKGGIVSYHTERYRKTGSAGLSTKYVYSVSQIPIYDHRNYRFIDTEVLVSRYKDSVCATFVFDNIMVSISGCPFGSNADGFKPENYKGLGFFDMLYTEPHVTPW